MGQLTFTFTLPLAKINASKGDCDCVDNMTRMVVVVVVMAKMVIMTMILVAIMVT